MDRRTTWERYVAAWKEQTVEGKRAALAASVVPGCVYRDPLVHAEGYDALIEHMLGFHRQVPGGHFETTHFLAHHERSVARWVMRGGDGAILDEGISYGEYDAEGRLVVMAAFFEVPQQS